MNIQTATSIEQSKLLLDLGVKADTADMYWYGNIYEEEPQLYMTTQSYNAEQCLTAITSNSSCTSVAVAAWSLSALLALIPELNHRVKYCYDFIANDNFKAIKSGRLSGDVILVKSENLFFFHTIDDYPMGNYPQGTTPIEAAVNFIRLLVKNKIKLNHA